ncbi:hypothetical protein AB9M62_32640 [Bacillales bacterium AN1005]
MVTAINKDMITTVGFNRERTNGVRFSLLLRNSRLASCGGEGR